MIVSGVTQTGQPGPWIRLRDGGSKRSRPCLTMEWVCPPQTSISVQGRVCRRAMASARAFTDAALRYSSRYFMAYVLQRGNLFQHRLRLGLVQTRNRETGMDDDIVADFGFRNVGQVDHLDHTAEIDPTGSQQGIV